MTADPTTCTQCNKVHLAYNGRPGCAGHKSSDRNEPCRKEPMEHSTVCLSHGGGSPQVREAAARRGRERQALRAAETFGLPVVVDPHTALLAELHRTAGVVAWLGAVVADLEAGDVVWGVTRVKSGGEDAGTTSEAGVSTWVSLWQSERKHLREVAKTCVDVGIEERRVRLAEADAALMAGLVQRVLGRLDLSPAQQALVGVVVPEEFRAVAALESGGRP